MTEEFIACIQNFREKMARLDEKIALKKDLDEQQVNPDEMGYLKNVERILRTGILRDDRTEVGTYSIFGMQQRFSLRNNVIPLLTTKRVFWKGIVEELLWIISGSTDVEVLQAKGIHFWDKNSSRDFLDKMGFTERAEGDLGPVYGFQWRHFGAKYATCKTDYTGQGVDQLANLISEIKSNPNSRRLVLSAWNPADLHLMVLPPCHTLCQFYVNNGELSCHLYQRSGDMGLGVPFNIASYSLLTHMIAHICGLKAAEFVHTLGDAHVYKNHVDALKIQIQRTPTEFPTVTFDDDVKSIDDFTFQHIHLQNYNPQGEIPMQMAV